MGMAAVKMEKEPQSQRGIQMALEIGKSKETVSQTELLEGTSPTGT